jgi:xanthine dehydrogenase accessory factor
VTEVLGDLAVWTGRGEQVAVATVVAVTRSAPMPPGTKMAVSDRGAVVGAVSGGCVEGAVIEVAEEILGGAEPRLLHYGIADSDAWDVGLPCGGEIDVWVERWAPAAGPQADFARVALDGGRAARVTVVASESDRPTGTSLLVLADGATSGGLGDPALDAAAIAAAEELIWAERSELRAHEDVTLFVDVTGPPPRLVIFGAVDFAAALCRVARAARWRPFVVDPRSRFATRERFPDAEDVIAEWPVEALAQLGGIDRATYIAVLTHDPKLDDAVLTTALESDAPYIGAMGSRRAQAKRRERLLAAGLTDAQLDRISAPIGLDLGGTSAEETAVSIMAELIAVRNGRDGGRLSASGGRIHEVGACRRVRRQARESAPDGASGDGLSEVGA